jgi:type II secretory pathway pseudopilin PulG
MKNNYFSKKRFTIVELIIVILIIGILASLLLPLLVRVRDKGQRTTNLNNLKQLYTAMCYYAQDNNDFFPYINVTPPNSDFGSLNSQSLFLILPYTKYNLELFYTPIIFRDDKSDPNSNLNTYLASPGTLIPAIESGSTNLMPGYAYSPVDNNGDAIRIGHNDLSDDLFQEDDQIISPLITTINGTYSDEAYMLMADGSVTCVNGTVSNDSIID